MAAVTICSDFGAQENKACHCSFFPHLFAKKWWDQMPWFVFWMLSFKPAFLPSSIAFIKWLFSFLCFLPLGWYHLYIWCCWYFSRQSWFQLVLHPACILNDVLCVVVKQQGDNTQPCHTPFPILKHSVVPCKVLTVASWPTYKFLRRQVRWSGIPISLRIFHSLLCST